VSALHIVTVTLRLAVAAEDAGTAEETVLATLEGLGVPAACPDALAPDFAALARPATLRDLCGLGVEGDVPWLVADGELTDEGDDDRSCAEWVQP
jgi:hypothetical protein